MKKPNGLGLIFAFWLTFTFVNCGNAQGIKWPLRISEGGRYLEDQNGFPFPIIGDSAWSMAGQLSPSEVLIYLDDRQSKGFNTIIVNAIEHEFSRNAPNNYNNDPPFTYGPSDWSVRGTAYWSHVDFILDAAKDRNFLVLLYPAYLGNQCGSEGWCSEMRSQTNSVMTDYGRFLGDRYKNQGNIIWVHGGDANCNNYSNACARVSAIASGIKLEDPNQLHSGSSAEGRSGMDDYNSLININTIYTYEGVASKTQEEYSRPGAKPVFFDEGYYENEHSTSVWDWWSQELIPSLGGAFGFVFGNCPIWHFGSDSRWCGTTNWIGNLNSTGSLTASNVGKLIKSRKWWGFVPDYSSAVVISPKGNGVGYHAAARESTGETVIVWCPNTSQITVDMTKLSGTQATAWWWDIYNNSSALIGTFATAGIRSFIPPRAGVVFVLDDASKNLAAPGTTVYLPDPPPSGPPGYSPPAPPINFRIIAP